MSGHTVLQLPVPELEDWVVRRTQHYDASFVSDDPRFAHAHITALGPFDPQPSRHTLDTVAAIAATTPPVEVSLAELGQFPNGIIHLVPRPAAPLERLTGRLAAAFPHHPPYAGIFGPDVAPHLTLDAAGPDVTVETTRSLLGDTVPVTCRLEVLQLAWWESGRCHVLHEWRLGEPGERQVLSRPGAPR